MASQAKGYLILPVWCDDGVIKPLVNDDGRIPVSIGESSITIDVNLESSDITLLTEEQSPLTYIQARQYGWHGSSWKPAGIPLNFESRIGQSGSHTATSTDTYTMDIGSPPANKLWVIQAMTCRNLDSVTTVRFVAEKVTTGYYLDVAISPAINVISVCRAVPFVLTEQDTAQVIFVSPTIDDRLRAYAWGYQVAV